MCIAIYKRIGNQLPSEEYLKNCWENNPDGAGFAFNTRDGRVRIVKGLMSWDAFKSTLDKYNKSEKLVERGMLIHFRIETHGGVCPECTHPFPVTSDETFLQKCVSVADYAVIHNGIISLTSADAHKKTKMSDTMVFVQKYLSKIATNKKWFSNPSNWELIYDLIDSKMACLNGRGEIMSTYGFEKEEKDGNYYSNTTYKWGRVKYYGGYRSTALAPYDGYGEGGWYEGDYYDYYGKHYGSYTTTDKTKSLASIPLMKLRPGEIAILDEFEDIYYDPEMDILMDEDGFVYWGDPESSFYREKEIECLGPGVFIDQAEKTFSFRKDVYINSDKITGMEYYDTEPFHMDRAESSAEEIEAKEDSK